MEDIKMIAQKAPYAWLKPELDAAFSAAMSSGEDFSGGGARQRLAQRLEQLLAVEQAFPIASAAAALRLAVAALELAPRAQVILPAFADAALAELVQAAGLVPVLADVQPDTFTLDAASVAQAVTPATAAILPVHLFGQCADMQPLREVAEKHNLWLLEEATQAFGAAYTWPDGRTLLAGALGHLGVTSFFPAKPLLPEGEGSAILSNHPNLTQSLEALQHKTEGEALTDELNALQAAMLEVKVKYIGRFIEARQRVAAFYDEAFAQVPQLQAPRRASYSTHTFQQYTITVAPAHRDRLQAHLRDNFIPSVVYYSQPLHHGKAFAGKYKAGAFPVATQLCQSVLSLPMHTELTEEQQAYICQQVRGYFAQYQV